MSAAVVVGLSLASAASFALSTNLKHDSAAAGPELSAFTPVGLIRFARATLSHPLWLAGIAADLVGIGLQIVALHLGALAIVQPLLVTGLVFALLFRRWRRPSRRCDPIGFATERRNLAWAGLLVAALIGFVSIAGLDRSAVPIDGVDRLPAGLAAVAGALVAGTAVAVARRLRPAAVGAAALGIAVGIIYAADAALLKALSDQPGVAAVLLSWQLYALIGLGAAGLLLCQLAYRAGPLTASQPAITAVDPLASVVIGVLIFDEHLRRGPWTGAGLCACVLLLALAVVGLARSQVAADPVVRSATGPVLR